MDTKPPKRDWAKIWIHVFFGALFGAVLGFRWFGVSEFALSTSPLPGIAFVAGSALLVGLVAGAVAESGWDE